MKLGTFREGGARAGRLPGCRRWPSRRPAAAPRQRAASTFPTNVAVRRPSDPNVRKATAIVNGEIITGTDVDQRLALILASPARSQLPPEELQRLRAQVLRNLIDETLQIQAAAQQDIKVEQREIDQLLRALSPRASARRRSSFAAYLRTIGSSERSLKRQIHGELAWQRLLRPQDRAVRQRRRGRGQGDHRAPQRVARHRSEYRVGEIFLSATPETAAEARANAAADRRAAPRRRLVPGLCPPVFRGLDRRGRRRSRLGPRRAAARRARRRSSARCRSARSAIRSRCRAASRSSP